MLSHCAKHNQHAEHANAGGSGGMPPRKILKIITHFKFKVYEVHRDDYNGLTSDIFQTILLNVRPLIRYLSNAMYGCPIKLGANVAINGFVRSFLKIYNHLWYVRQLTIKNNYHIVRIIII